MNTKIMFLLCSIFMLGCTTSALENGAIIIPGKEGNDIIKVPPPPEGYDLIMVEIDDNLHVLYKNITTRSVVVVRYFAGNDNDPAKNYIIEFDY